MNDSGFTLIELLVSLAIVGVLASVAIPALTDYKEMAQRAKVQTELHNIVLAINVLEADTASSPGGHDPSPCVVNQANNEMGVDDCSAGLRCNDGSFDNWSGPYLSAEQVLDPWGTAYQYDQDYFCNPRVNGCSSSQWVKAVNSAGPDLVVNNYDPEEVTLVICSN